MKKIDLGQSLAILANVGVLAGVIFVGIEIRDSNTQARIGATQELEDQRAGWKESIAADGELSAIYAKGLADFEQLSLVERARFDLIMKAFMNRLTASFLARDEGLVVAFDVGLEQRGLEGEILYMLDQPGFRRWWSTVDRRGFPPTIVEITDALEAR